MSDVTEWQAADVEAAIGPTLDRFVLASKPMLRDCAEAVYEQLLYSVQDYLRDNAQWNLGSEIDRCRKIEAENRELRARLEPLAGIENPAAFVEAARGMAEALAEIEAATMSQFATVSDLANWRGVRAEIALTAFRQAAGEA